MKLRTTVLMVTMSATAACAQVKLHPTKNANLATAIATNANAMISGQAAGEYVETRTLKVLTPQQIDPGRLLPPPPPDGSESQIVDLYDWRRVVEERTPERYKQAKWDNEHEDISAFAAVIGPKFDLTKLPATAKLIAKIDNDQHIAASDAKVYFHRRFPVASSPLLGDYQPLLMRRRCEEAGRPAPQIVSQRPRDHGLYLRGRSGVADSKSVAGNPGARHGLCL